MSADTLSRPLAKRVTGLNAPRVSTESAQDIPENVIQAAVDALQRGARQASLEQARSSAVILADYLRARFGLTAAEPTPAEISAHLLQAGIATPTAEALASFFRACDGVRFAGGSERNSLDWPGTARQLILTLEAAVCSSPSR